MANVPRSMNRVSQFCFNEFLELLHRYAQWWRYSAGKLRYVLSLRINTSLATFQCKGLYVNISFSIGGGGIAGAFFPPRTRPLIQLFCNEKWAGCSTPLLVDSVVWKGAEMKKTACMMSFVLAASMKRGELCGLIHDGLFEVESSSCTMTT